MFWGLQGTPCCVRTLPLHHPCLGMPPLHLHPHTQLLVPCALVCSGISVCYVGIFPSVEGFGGVPPSVVALGDIST